MKQLARIWLVALLAVTLSTVIHVPEAMAASYQLPSTCDDHVGLTNHIAGCVRDVLDNATASFFSPSTGFYSLVSKAIAGALSLAVILFGGLAAFGMVEKAGRDSMMLLIKIAAVGYFVTNTQYIYDNVLSMMDKTAESVVNFVPATGPADNAGTNLEQITCLKNMHDAQQSSNPQLSNSGPWLAMDCMLDSVFGIKVDPKNPVPTNALSQAKAYNEKLKDDDKGLSRGLLYFFFSSYNSSVMGVILAIIGFIFLWGLLSMIVKALFIYLAGYLGVAIVSMVGPLFIPMVLFQSTRQYFDKWVKLLISFAMQPVIILAFIVMTITAVDLATFSGNYSVMYRLAGEESRKSDFSLNTYLTCARAKNNPATCLQSTQGMDPNDIVRLISKKSFDIAKVKGDTKDSVETQNTAGGLISGLEESKCTKALMDQDQQLKEKCEQTYSIKMWKENVDWKLAADVRNPAVTLDTGVQDKGEQLSKEVMAAIIFAAIVVFVMNGLLQIIPVVSYDLFGDFGQSPNLSSVTSAMPGQGGLRGMLQSKFGGKR